MAVKPLWAQALRVCSGWLQLGCKKAWMGSLAVTGEGLQFQAANLQKEVQGRGVAPSTPPASTPAAQYTGGGW